MKSSRLVVSATASLLLLTQLPRALATCYDPTPPYPPPVLRRDDRNVRSLFESIKDVLSNPGPEMPIANVSFSLEVTSADETLWSYHHTAESTRTSRWTFNETGDDRLHVSQGPSQRSQQQVLSITSDYDVLGRSEINEHSIYRIASISKVFTVLAMLMAHDKGLLDLDKPITYYIKELQSSSDELWQGVDGTRPDWNLITLRTLGSQLSGIQRESARMTSAWDLKHNLGSQREALQLGFPPVNRSMTPSCGDTLGSFNCSRSEILGEAASQRPVYAPMFKSTYSNLAFVLLGMALENVTAMPYNDLVQKWIFNPLNMTDSSGEKPDDSRGAIVGDGGFWNASLGYYNATGGIYSSTHSLSRFQRRLLSTPSLRNLWLRPHSFMPGGTSSFGMPWEVYHSDNFLQHGHRHVTFYTKAGDVPGYTSFIILIPEQGLGISILATGEGLAPAKVKFWLREALTRLLVPGVEDIAVEQMRRRYAGRYVYSASLDATHEFPSESTAEDNPENDPQTGTSPRSTPLPPLNSSIDLAVSPERGLYVTSWISNGSDFLAEFGAMQAVKRAAVGGDPNGRWSARVIPSMLSAATSASSKDHAAHSSSSSSSSSSADAFVEEVWRIKYAPEKSPSSSSRPKLLWDDFCLEDVQGMAYAGLDINELVFETRVRGREDEAAGKDVRASAVRIRGLRVRLERVGAGRWT